MASALVFRGGRRRVFFLTGAVRAASVDLSGLGSLGRFGDGNHQLRPSGSLGLLGGLSGRLLGGGRLLRAGALRTVFFLVVTFLVVLRVRCRPLVASGLGVGLLAESFDSSAAAWSLNHGHGRLHDRSYGFGRSGLRDAWLPSPSCTMIVPAGWLSQMQVFQAPRRCRGVLVAIDPVGRSRTGRLFVCDPIMIRIARFQPRADSKSSAIGGAGIPASVGDPETASPPKSGRPLRRGSGSLRGVASTSPCRGR